MKKVINVFLVAVCFALSTSAFPNQSAEHPLSDNRRDDIEESSVNSSQFQPNSWNAKGQPVFDTLPVTRNWYATIDKGPNVFTEIGDYVDLNGDGLLDYAVSYCELNCATFYRATFISNGDATWTMVACKCNMDWSQGGGATFAPCSLMKVNR